MEARIASRGACLPEHQGRRRVSPAHRGLPVSHDASLDLSGDQSTVVHQPDRGWGLGLPPKVVQERLGHSSITMTYGRYGHLFPRGDDAKALDAAEGALLAT